MMRLIKIAPIALLVGLAATGCGASPDPDPNAAQTNQALNAPAADGESAGPEGGRFRGRGGPMAIFHEALGELDLTADQKAKIQTALDAAKAGGPEHEHERGKGPAVFADIADGVRAGKIDEAAIAKKLDALAAEHAEGPAKMAAAFQTLHDTLTADQRSKLVASMKAKMEAFEEKMAEHREAHGPPPDGAGPPFMRGIELRDDQKANIQKALADAGMSKPEGKARFEEMRGKMKASLDAFAADKFDASQTFAAMKGGPRDHVEKMVKALAVVVPLLDEAQRNKLADNLAEGPMRHRGHHGPEDDAAPGAP